MSPYGVLLKASVVQCVVRKLGLTQEEDQMILLQSHYFW